MAIFIVIANCLVIGLLSVRIVNYLQLNNYKLGFCSGEFSHYNKIFVATIIAIVASMGFLQIKSDLFYGLATIIFYIPFIVVIFWDFLDEHKTPLVYTKRVWRYFLTLTVFNVGISILTIYLSRLLCQNDSLFSFLQFLLLPLYCRLILLINEPMEACIKKRYILKSKKILKSKPNLIKIGITGSYAKTSVKNILNHILSYKYNVVASPKSFNTPMGIAKTVSEIDDNTEILIAEMGARYIGDITKLCEIVEPNIGIITGITNQHLETFKSIENIVDTKYELIKFLEKSGQGKAVFNGENIYVKRMYKKCHLEDKTLVNVGSGHICAKNIRYNARNTEFDLRIATKSVTCKTKLLGKHNLENILLAVNVADYLGMDIETIAGAVNNLEYAKHRLEVIQTENMTILDDSYNANSEGVKQALEALARFKERKVIMTQGIVELGAEMIRENYNLGMLISKVADIAIIVGKQSVHIKQGLLDAGYNPTKIAEFSSLKEATLNLNNVLKANDVLLIMNDLPDNY